MRATLIGSMGLLGLALVLAFRPLPAVGPATRTPVPVVQLTPPSVPRPVDPAIWIAPPAGEDAVAEAVGRVRTDCGLPIHAVCEGQVCVSVASMPDLDRTLGWVELAWTHPGFVLQTAARDLGYTASPCAYAMSLGFPHGATTFEAVGEPEIWCGSPTGPPDPAVCLRAAQQVLGRSEPFTGSARTLRF